MKIAPLLTRASPVSAAARAGPHPADRMFFAKSQFSRTIPTDSLEIEEMTMLMAASMALWQQGTSQSFQSNGSGIRSNGRSVQRWVPVVCIGVDRGCDPRLVEDVRKSR